MKNGGKMPQGTASFYNKFGKTKRERGGGRMVYIYTSYEH